MKITICGSMKFAKEMIEIANILDQKGFKTLLPEMAKPFTEGKFSLSSFADDRTDADFKKSII